MNGNIFPNKTLGVRTYNEGNKRDDDDNDDELTMV
jgi:hypothetical protein